MIGVERYGFLFGLALVWIVFAVVQDLKKREVANWLNFSLIAFALAYRFAYSSYLSDWMFFVYGLMGFGLFFVVANALYYSRVFAGGDAKLLMGLGAVLPFESFWDIAIVGGVFVLLLFFVGAVYSLVYSLFLVRKNYEKFSRGFGKNVGSVKLWAYALFFSLFFVVLVYYLAGVDILLLLIAALFGIFVFLLVVYAKSLDVCMIKFVSPSLLTEGDWLVGDIKVGKAIVRKTVHGLTLDDITLLRKAGKKVLIKEGIPFTPAFLFAFVIMVFFWGALESLVLSLL